MDPEEMPESMPGEEGEELPADPEMEGEVVGDDSEGSVGLASDNGGGDVGSIMADLEAILASLGGGAEEEEEDPLAVPDDQYGA